MLKVGASALRGDGTNPDATSSAISGGIGWERVGGMAAVVQRLREAAEYPLTRAEEYKRFGLAPPRGILLYGPPGCSKTTLVRALAGAVSASFFALSGAEVFSPWVGDAESCVRKVFARARAASPSILFLDEVDAMVGSRGIGGAGGQGTSVGVLATLLTEMDGVAAAGGVLVVAATNRKEVLDPALLRPGRLEVHIHVPLPDAKGREEILAVHTAKAELADDVDLAALASDASTGGWSGAALEGLAREAAMEALREDIHGARQVCGRHFEAALRAIKISTN
jgi:SpoVK/Ycf46/Vps4 family AAA+-type ATPase